MSVLKHTNIYQLACSWRTPSIMLDLFWTRPWSCQHAFLEAAFAERICQLQVEHMSKILSGRFQGFYNRQTQKQGSEKGTEAEDGMSRCDREACLFASLLAQAVPTSLKFHFCVVRHTVRGDPIYCICLLSNVEPHSPQQEARYTIAAEYHQIITVEPQENVRRVNKESVAACLWSTHRFYT